MKSKRDIKSSAKNKQEIYTSCCDNYAEDNHEVYKQNWYIALEITRKNNEQFCYRLKSNIDHDIHRRQNLSYKVVKSWNNQQYDRM